MHVGYCEVYSNSFRSFFDEWCERSWNIPSQGMKVPQERKFHRYESSSAKILGTFATEERKFHRSESSTEQKFSVDFSLPGTKVQMN